VPDASQVGADFAPYQTAGQWALADSGDWMWQSDYAWGYIPFHYGRWVWSGNYWGWIPGRRYAPAWVTWRVGDGGYLGWAPMPPTWYWGRGVAVGLWTTPYAAYCFVPVNYAFSRGVSAYVVRDRGLIGSIAATTRPYHAATPTVGGRPASPRLSEAHIPASAAPRAHAGADGRAMAFATRSSTAVVRGGHGSPSTFNQWHSGYQGYQHPSYQGYQHPSYQGYQHPSYQGYQHPSRGQAQGLRTPGREPVYSGSHASPSFHPSYGHPSYGNMSYGHPSVGSPAAHAPAVHPSSSHTQSSAPSTSVHASPGRSGGGGRHR
jgi:hypothetical protein